MLGLADRTRVIDLFEKLAGGDIAGAFKEFREQYDVGADPIVVLSDLAEFVNFVTRVKIVPATPTMSPLARPNAFARGSSPPSSRCACSRGCGRCCCKGIAEVQTATRPAAAAEMVLVRIAMLPICRLRTKRSG
jgi:DNA polymerase-3 subunit gamma/tau